MSPIDGRETGVPEGLIQVLKGAVVSFSLFVITLSVNLQVPLYSAYADAAGYGNGLVSVTFSAYVAGLLPVLIFMGGVSDRIGRKVTMLVAISIALLENLLMIIEPSMQMLLKVRVMQGVAVGLSLGAATAYLAEIFDDPARVSSISGMGVTLGLGGGALVTSIALLYRDDLIPYSYYAVTACTLVCLLCMLAMPEENRRKSASVLRVPLLIKSLFRYFAAIFVAWSMTGIIIATLPAELQRLGAGSWSGLLVFLSICTGALLQPVTHRLGPERALTGGYILMAVAWATLLVGVWVAQPGLLLAASALAGASSFGLIYKGGLVAVIGASGKEKARAVSGYFLFAYLGLGVPCILVGYLADQSGLRMALSWLSLPMIIVLLLGRYSRGAISRPGKSCLKVAANGD